MSPEVPVLTKRDTVILFGTIDDSVFKVNFTLNEVSLNIQSILRANLIK